MNINAKNAAILLKRCCLLQKRLRQNVQNAAPQSRSVSFLFFLRQWGDPAIPFPATPALCHQAAVHAQAAPALWDKKDFGANPGE